MIHIYNILTLSEGLDKYLNCYLELLLFISISSYLIFLFYISNQIFFNLKLV